MPIRPALAALAETALEEARAAVARQDAPAAAAACTRAAEVYAGSPDADELGARHDAFAEAGAILRRAGKLAEAEAAYERQSEAARQELGAGARPFLLARYFVGLVRTEAGNDEGAAAALHEAFAGFARQPGAEREARLIGAALGLACLRARRWDEVVEVLQRYADSPLEDESAAAILHNLAIALVRRGDAAAGLSVARSAVALRRKLNGPEHPFFIETQLVEALALVDIGQLEEAAPLIQQAAQRILAGAGEAHAFFSDALLIEGRRLARLGDGAAGEALARRALFVAERAGMPESALADRRFDAAAIGPLWRTVAPAASPRDVRLWRVELQHTLRRYRAETLDFLGSGDAPKVWYYFVPAAARPDDADTALRLVRLALADASAALCAREPADANFLDVTSFVAREPGLAEFLATPMHEVIRARTWENAVAYSVVDGKHGRALPAGEFALALNAWVTLRGGQADVATWVGWGIDENELAIAVAQPDAVLREILWQA